MDKKLQKIIKSSNFNVEKGRFVYVKVASISGIDKHFLISKDKDEITVVTREEYLSKAKEVLLSLGFKRDLGE